MAESIILKICPWQWNAVLLCILLFTFCDWWT